MHFFKLYILMWIYICYSVVILQSFASARSSHIVSVALRCWSRNSLWPTSTCFFGVRDISQGGSWDEDWMREQWENAPSISFDERKSEQWSWRSRRRVIAGQEPVSLSRCARRYMDRPVPPIKAPRRHSILAPSSNTQHTFCCISRSNTSSQFVKHNISFIPVFWFII